MHCPCVDSKLSRVLDPLDHGRCRTSAVNLRLSGRSNALFTHPADTPQPKQAEAEQSQGGRLWNGEVGRRDKSLRYLKLARAADRERKGLIAGGSCC